MASHSLPHVSTLLAILQLCFYFVAAIFRLRKLLKFNTSISQTIPQGGIPRLWRGKVCGYKNPKS
jgi:hypothetical protein